MPNGHAINFHYRIGKYPEEAGDPRPISPRNAAQIARDALLREWQPYHWHLDSVNETSEFYHIGFTGLIDTDEWMSHEDETEYERERRRSGYDD